MFSSSIIYARMRTRKQRTDITFRQQFIDKGCDRHMLDSLLGEYGRSVQRPRSVGEESRSTVKKLKSLRERLNTIASEIEQLQAKPLKFLCGRSLGQWVSPLLVSFNTTLIRSEAENLKKAANMVSRSTRRRKDFRREAIAKLYALCCHVPWERKKARAITYKDVAELLNEYEVKKGFADPDNPVLDDAVRRAVERDSSRRKLKEQRCLTSVGQKMLS
jgi:hypothetical protein